MKITIVNGAPNPPDTNHNLLNCKIEALISYNPSNNLSSTYTPSDDPSPPRPRRIKTSTPPPIICNFAPTNTASSPTAVWSPSGQYSPCVKSPWAAHLHRAAHDNETLTNPKHKISPKQGLIGTLIRHDGYIYSIATAAGDMLYTGSDSKNIRVWKNMQEFSAFKSSSGLVKAIVVSADRIFTGHQDGKVRIWKQRKESYVRVGNLPRSQDLIVKSMNPRNYVSARRKRNVPWIKHYDAVSCLSIDSKHGILYSGSWDKSLKVWRISDSKCLESIPAHDDAVNAVVVAAEFGGLVFTGSADGTVKAWRRSGRVARHDRTRHVLVETLLRQDHALTSLAVSHAPGVVYAGSSDGLVYFWEREKDGAVAYGGALRGHKSAVLCVAAAGRLVVSGSADRSICVWRRDVGGEHGIVAVLTGHDGPVKCLAVARDTSAAAEMEEEDGSGNWIVYSGSLDKSVKIWRVSEDARACKAPP